jgi:hypothetical protein
VATPEQVDVRVGLDVGKEEHFAELRAGWPCQPARVTTELAQAA